VNLKMIYMTLLSRCSHYNKSKSEIHNP